MDALRVETEEANDARLDSLRLREILERFCAREFFLDEDADRIGRPSSPIDPRDAICLAKRFAAASFGSGGSLEEEGELLMSSASQEWADWGSRVARG